MRRVAVLTLVLAASIPCVLAADAGDRDYRWFDPIIDLRSIVESSYVETPDEKAMQEAALSAMMRSLGDPYSVYVPPAAERSFNKDLRGNYVGIGAEIDMPDGWLRVVTPLDGSPAHDAGIMPSDIVLTIGGESTHGKAIEECMSMLLGDPGTTVKLRVRHTDGREEDFAIARRAIQARTVKGFRRSSSSGWEHMLDPEHGIAYVQLAQFTETTAADLRATLDKLREAQAQGLIIDLRNDGGGSLGAAIQIADYFLKQGTIVSLKARDGQGRDWQANDEASDLDVPIVILVNEASASASEILAGTLQDNGRAKVLGTRTFGKGSVQDVKSLPDGTGTVKITTARYYLPKRGNISRSHKASDEGLPWGIDPDPGFHVVMDDAQRGPMYLARRRWEIPDGKPTDAAKWADPAWVGAAPGEDGVSGIGDVQLAAAMTTLKSKITGQDWKAVGDDANQETAKSDELGRARAYRERLQREVEATDKRIFDLEAQAMTLKDDGKPTKKAVMPDESK